MGGWIKHNGWTNYETWRVNLEIFDGMDVDYWADHIEDLRGSEIMRYELGEHLKQFVEDAIECDNEVAYGYASAFISVVNYTEIAEGIIDEYWDNYCCDNCRERCEDDFCSEECEREYELLASHSKG